MWYFSWILGTAFACSFAVIYALWFELRATREKSEWVEKIK